MAITCHPQLVSPGHGILWYAPQHSLTTLTISQRHRAPPPDTHFPGPRFHHSCIAIALNASILRLHLSVSSSPRLVTSPERLHPNTRTRAAAPSNTPSPLSQNCPLYNHPRRRHLHPRPRCSHKRRSGRRPKPLSTDHTSRLHRLQACLRRTHHITMPCG